MSTENAITTGDRDQLGISWIAWLGLALVAAVVGVGAGWSTVVVEGRLVQNDSYERVNRVLASFEAGKVLDYVPRDNAGDVVPLHWSHFLDGLIALLSWPLIPLFGPAKAFHYGGAAVGPVSIFAAAVAVVIATRRIAGSGSHAVVVGTLAVVAPSVLGYGMLGQADHHVLLGAAAAGALGLAYGPPAAGSQCPSAVAGGLVAATGLWLSPEMLPFAVAAWAVTILSDIEYRGVMGCRSLAYVFGLAVGISTAWFADPPTFALAAEPDRLSIPHVVLAALIMIATLAARMLSSRLQGRWPQSIAAGLLVTAALVAWAAVFPTMPLGPVSAIAPGTWDRIWGHMLEMAPLTTTVDLAIRLGVFPTLAVGVGVLVFVWSRPGPLSTFVALSGIVIAVAAWLHLRLTVYLQLAAAVVVGALLVVAIMRATSDRMRAAAIAAALLYSILPMTSAIVLHHNMALNPRASCDLPSVAPFLQDLKDRVVLTELSYSPQLIYFTPATAVAGPYHRSAIWIERLYRAWDETQFASVLPDTLAVTRATAILVCRNDVYPVGTLGAALARGATPPWLHPLPMPPDTGFRLLEVVSDRK